MGKYYCHLCLQSYPDLRTFLRHYRYTLCHRRFMRRVKKFTKRKLFPLAMDIYDFLLENMDSFLYNRHVRNGLIKVSMPKLRRAFPTVKPTNLGMAIKLLEHMGYIKIVRKKTFLGKTVYLIQI